MHSISVARVNTTTAPRRRRLSGDDGNRKGTERANAMPCRRRRRRRNFGVAVVYFIGITYYRRTSATRDYTE